MSFSRAGILPCVNGKYPDWENEDFDVEHVYNCNYCLTSIAITISRPPDPLPESIVDLGFELVEE
jgi:hypothetical protein